MPKETNEYTKQDAKNAKQIIALAQETKDLSEIKAVLGEVDRYGDDFITKLMDAMSALSETERDEVVKYMFDNLQPETVNRLMDCRHSGDDDLEDDDEWEDVEGEPEEYDEIADQFGIIDSCDLDAVRKVIESGKFTDPNVADHNGLTVLHHAAKIVPTEFIPLPNILELVKILLSVKNIDPNARDNEGNTPAMLAEDGYVIQALSGVEVSGNIEDSGL